VEEESLILILYSQDDTMDHGAPQEMIAFQYTATVADHLNAAVTKLGYHAELVPANGTIASLRRKLDKYSRDRAFIFNNCDGFGGKNINASRVPALLGRMGFKFTGSTGEATALCTNKKRCKKRLIECGVPTPRFQLFSKPKGDFKYDYPAIIKPVVEDASMGIDLESVVSNMEQLHKRIAYVVERYQQPALVEEYIIGRELSVSLWGNGEVTTLPIVEEDYSKVENPLEQLLTFDSKWNPDSYLYQTIIWRCPAPLAPEDDRRVREAAIAAYKAVGLRDIGRVDIRYRDGIAYVIDINELPDLSPESGFPRSAQIGGISYEQMVGRILDLSFHREGLR
jgi:D-alanine-D-alanine ligase